MRTLILDTSTERGVAALIDYGKERFSIELPFGLQHAQLLLPELERSMKEQAIGWDQIELIGVGIGPGSYTGIRVGSMIAKTLAYCFKIPLVGICTLEGFIPREDGIFAALIDAKIGGVYLQKGSMQQGKVEWLLGPMVVPLLDVGEWLSDVSMVVSPNISPLKLRLGFESSFRWHEYVPSVSRLAEIAETQFKLGHYSMDGRIELLYMRKTQAELERLVFPS